MGQAFDESKNDDSFYQQRTFRQRTTKANAVKPTTKMSIARNAKGLNCLNDPR
ncbi:hypothetical protein HGK72_19745 [Mycolicibacterium fortuitum]|nr:hypothetical protein [Mycolicibacterium fortuitum]